MAGAAQLGAAQALALLVWSSVPTPEVWRRQLMWLLFMYAAAVLVGVAGGRRSVRMVRHAIAIRRAEAAAARNSGLVLHETGLRAARQRALASARYKTVDTARGFAAGASRVGATVFASLGAYTSFLLVWLPTRDTYAAAAVRVLGFAALLGTGVGAVLSQLALLAAPIAANAAVWVAGVWIFGLSSVAVAIATDVPTITPRLAVLDAPHLIGPGEWWFGPSLMVVVAAAFAGAVAAGARWIGAHRLGIALSGLAGPAIVAAGYLVVGPQPDLRSSYISALVAAAVGLITSAVISALPRKPAVAGTAVVVPPAIAQGTAPARAIAAAPAAPVYTDPGYATPATTTPSPATPYPAPQQPAPPYATPQ